MTAYCQQERRCAKVPKGAYAIVDAWTRLEFALPVNRSSQRSAHWSKGMSSITYVLWYAHAHQAPIFRLRPPGFEPRTSRIEVHPLVQNEPAHTRRCLQMARFVLPAGAVDRSIWRRAWYARCTRGKLPHLLMDADPVVSSARGHANGCCRGSGVARLVDGGDADPVAARSWIDVLYHRSVALAAIAESP